MSAAASTTTTTTRQKSEWRVHCRPLATGKEIWQFRESREIRPNHAITRTVPAVDGRYVFSLDPKCVLHCLDAKTGKEFWRKNLVTRIQDHHSALVQRAVPADRERTASIIATGGDAIMVALDKATGKEIWRTPNPGKLLLSHASVMPAVLGGVKQYLYGTLERTARASRPATASCCGSSRASSTWPWRPRRWPSTASGSS